MIYTNESTQIFCADNVIFANTILTDSVSLTVSSPPYDALRDYTYKSTLEHQ
jgi:hypothetical protein